MTDEHVCEVCYQPSWKHHDPKNLAPRCCYGCPCGVTFSDPSNDPEQRVAAGWNTDHTLRWIEVGNLRLEEDEHGARAVTLLARTGPQQVPGSTWLSATELAGLSRHLAAWFTDDPADQVRQIEACATFVKVELEAWDERARIDEEHPPYNQLVRTLDTMLDTCKRLREEGLFADWPTKIPPPSLASRLRDPNADKHPAYGAFCRQMRGRVYGDEPLNLAWNSFKDGWT